MTPAWRSISIAARVLPAAVWAPPSARERAATLTWPAAVVVPAAVQAMATRPRAAQVAPPTGQAGDEANGGGGAAGCGRTGAEAGAGVW